MTAARIALFAFLTAGISVSGSAEAQTTVRVSVDSNGVEGNYRSLYATVSRDGRWATFDSDASNLVPNDINGVGDVFLRDIALGVTTRVSVDSTGAPGLLASEFPCVSAHGRWVVFRSGSVLAPGDSNAVYDVYAHDTATGETRVLSDADAAGPLNSNASFDACSFSADERYCAFPSGPAIYVEDLVARTTRSITISGFNPTISADGNHVAFVSPLALVPGDTTRTRDVYVCDLRSGALVRASLSTSGAEADGDCLAPSLSGDGRWVTFTSYATNLAPMPTTLRQIFVRDRDADGNGVFDEPGTSATILVSTLADGRPSPGHTLSPTISAGGRFVAFAGPPALAGDGPTEGYAPLLRDRDADGNGVFDEPGGVVTIRLDVSWDGFPVDAQCAPNMVPWMSDDASTFVFESESTNLVPDDRNGSPDIFAFLVPRLSLRSISPDSGSALGGDPVRLVGAELGTAGDLDVRFGAAPATIVEASATLLRVATPPGAGTVDVSVTRGTIRSTLAAAFTYVSPGHAARYGTVNLGRGDRENVLLVNALTGDPSDRVVRLGVRRPVTVTMTPPSGRATARFAIFAWAGEPDDTTLRAVGRGVGFTVFPTPLRRSDSPQPFAIGNDLDVRLGAPTFATSPAPTIVGRSMRGLPRPQTVTLQGVIEDDGSVSPLRVSVTNAIVVRVE
jgi:Tol biopolymer transport system component